MPERLQLHWQVKLASSGLGGIAATEKYVVFGDRDANNLLDVFRCLSAKDGTPLWTVEYPAFGELDYGNSPRTTPLIHGDLVFLLGAFGDLTCAKLETGATVWRRNLRLDFAVDDELVWGACSSPLIAGGKLIVNPGAKEASLVALEPATGKLVWSTPGAPHGYGSLIAARLGGVEQIVGHDRVGLGGWDVKTGQRLWTVKPPREGDFNVPTPVVVGDKLLVVTENNATRLFAFGAEGRIIEKPIAECGFLAPDMSTPVVVAGRVFCAWGDAFCLDAKKLQEVWTGGDKALAQYCAVIGGQDRVLIIGAGGQLLLVDARADALRVISRLTVFDEVERNVEIYSHPALVGTRLYLRGDSALACVELAAR